MTVVNLEGEYLVGELNDLHVLHLGHAVKHRVLEFAFQTVEFVPDLFVHQGLGLGIHSFDFIVKIDLSLAFVKVHFQVFAIQGVSAGNGHAARDGDGHTILFHLVLSADEEFAGPAFIKC